MYYITEICDGCGLCASSCPFDIIIESGRVYSVGIGCNSCGACAGICPRGAIRLKK